MQHHSYKELIYQTYDFPTQWFDVNEEWNLIRNNIDLLSVVKNTNPAKISYLPKIREKIQYARKIFNAAIDKYFYDAEYIYSYCTKSSHFEFVLDQVTSVNAQLELSSEFDVKIVEKLLQEKKINSDTLIICNGYKPKAYLERILWLQRSWCTNIIIVFDNKDEIELLDTLVQEWEKCKVWLRVATEDEPNTDIYTSRLGTKSKDIIDLYTKKIEPNTKFVFSVLHFFINTKIKDTSYYRSELSRIVWLYCDLKRLSKTLQYLDIGWWFPIATGLNFEYDYEYMADQIVRTIKHVCESEDIPVPHIISEFWSYTVGESGATIFKVIWTKKQNDKELRYMINSSLITTLPDIRGINQKFLVLPINCRNNGYGNTIIWGITCDNDDFYNKDIKWNQIILPQFNNEEEDLYIWFFHTWAYQESLWWYGGIQHCLIPSPQHLLIDQQPNWAIEIKEFSGAQNVDSMLKILWYTEQNKK